MKKHCFRILVMIIAFGISYIGCDNNPTNVPQTITYRGIDLGENEYT